MRLLSIWITALILLAMPVKSYAVDYVNTINANINNGTACGTTDIVRDFAVTDNFIIADVNLGFQVTHAWRGDINLRLRSPAGTVIQLIATNTGGGGNIDNYNIQLDDDATTLINTAPHNTPDGTVAPPYENLVRPNLPLSNFNGENSLGTWSILICDAFPTSDNGVFNISTLSLIAVSADVTAVKSVEVFDPANLGLYMTPGNEILYTITVNNSAAATAPASGIDISDTLPDNLTFVSAVTTGFTGGAFGSPTLPAANTDCTGGNCVISFAGGSLPQNTTGEIVVRAIIQ